MKHLFYLYGLTQPEPGKVNTFGYLTEAISDAEAIGFTTLWLQETAAGEAILALRCVDISIAAYTFVANNPE